MEELFQYTDILNDRTFLSLRKYIAHGNTTVLRHSLLVAIYCLKINRIFKLNADIDKLVTSALLHDLYLYDWHHAPKEAGLHGFTHPLIAANNAKKYFGINNEIAQNIITHMWPLTFLSFPKTKEGFILCIADKVTAINEVFKK